VRDGDTIEVAGVPVRLSGLAAPEHGQPGGAEAVSAMRELVAGRGLFCQLDGTRTHDRCAGTCCLNGADIAAMLIRQGLARDCPRFSGGRYAADEREAARAGATIGEVYRLPGYCRPRRTPPPTAPAGLARAPTASWRAGASRAPCPAASHPRTSRRHRR
jgi:hypothetical protein